MTTEQIDAMSTGKLEDFAARQDAECRSAEHAAERAYGLTGEGRVYAAYQGWQATYARQVISQRKVESAICANPASWAVKHWQRALKYSIMPAKMHAASQMDQCQLNK